MKRFGAGVFSALMMLGSSLAVAADDAEAWLQRLSQASRSLNFEGVFVYQSQGRSETSRVIRLVDESGERERLVALDGAPREVVRHNEEVYSYLPEAKVLVLDRVPFGRQPGRLSISPAQLREHYLIRLEGSARVAGREARVLSLEPRDELRYGHMLWIDAASGLLLKARMRAGRDAMVEQFIFTEITPGGVIDPERLQASTQKTSDWRVLDARGQALRPDAVPWVFSKVPGGFSQVALVRRVVRRDGVEAVHAVFSDGLVNLSVFIEALATQAAAHLPDSAILAGSTGIYRRVLGEHVVTVMGEVPEPALRMVAYGVERRKN